MLELSLSVNSDIDIVRVNIDEECIVSVFDEEMMERIGECANSLANIYAFKDDNKELTQALADYTVNVRSIIYLIDKKGYRAGITVNERKELSIAIW